MGRAAARTLGHDIVNTRIANPTTYDSKTMFNTEHGNLLSGASAFLSEDAGAQAATLLRLQTDEGSNERIGLRPRTLVLPPQMELIARRILASTLVPEPQTGVAPVVPSGMTGWNTQQFGRGGDNVMRAFADYVIEPYFTDANDWYLFADQNEAPLIGAGFLNGVETPDIFLKDPGMRNVLGGSDPYNMVFYNIVWKIRADWGVGILDWRGGVKGSVP
jgi:hypothetical protein